MLGPQNFLSTIHFAIGANLRSQSTLTANVPKNIREKEEGAIEIISNPWLQGIDSSEPTL